MGCAVSIECPVAPTSLEATTLDATSLETLDNIHVLDMDLQKEFKQNSNRNVSYIFQDIVDDKHMKYMKHYQTESNELFWGIGVENETYGMLSSRVPFSSLTQHSERYSVDYYKNFKHAALQKALHSIRKDMLVPVYVNSHTFQKTDTMLCHRTHYNKDSTPNPDFTESIHDRLMRESAVYREVYDTSLVYDGDSIEFITQDFYCTTVHACVHELVSIKRRVREDICPRFEAWNLGTLSYPDYNYGFATFLTTHMRYLALCNTGTLHINLTLPTRIQNGMIADKNEFATTHLAFIRCIQMLEPLFVACYGTPDALSLLDRSYSIGSLRLSRSRYISLHTFDVEKPVNGKLLLMDKPKEPTFWYNQLKSSPYHLNLCIGYDINFNKFKNHGVEIRFFDWFPEEYLEDVMNLFVLLGVHSRCIDTHRFDKKKYNRIIHTSITKGWTTPLDTEECNVILNDLCLPLSTTALFPIVFLQRISDALYDMHSGSEWVRLLSPQMKRPVLVNYNKEVCERLYREIHGLPLLVIRAEITDTRAPIAPCDLHLLLPFYRVYVESSAIRCFSDELYRKEGAIVVKPGYWKDTRDSVIVGLKELYANDVVHHSHTLLHFSHCFKGQKNSRRILEQLRSCTFLDYEFMLHEGARVISFCPQSGKVGAYLALMAYYYHHSKGHVFSYHNDAIPPFEESVYVSMLSILTKHKKPRVLLIGYGKAGRRAKEILDQFGIETTVWTSKTTREPGVIQAHDILLHAIRIPDDPTIVYEPFLKKGDGMGSLSVICDISCDMGNPRNTLPLYDSYTTAAHPVRRLDNGVDLIAINHLPSLEPVVSSLEFSATLVPMLPDVRWVQWHVPSPMLQSYHTFLHALKS